LEDYPERESPPTPSLAKRGKAQWKPPLLKEVSSECETEDFKEIVWSTTLDSAGPLFNRNYFWTFTDTFIEKNKKKYFEINPKEVIEPWMKIKYLSPDDMGELKIIDIINEQWKQLEKAHCNTWNVYVLTDKKLQGRELLYE
jgi:hypothetical protein